MVVAECSPEDCRADLEIEGTDAEVQGDGQHEDDGGMAQREEEPDPERALTFVDQLAGGVVDGRDVVGVEGVAHAQREGQDAGAQTEQLRLRNMEVVADGHQQERPADDVEHQHGQRHAADPGPLAPGEPAAHRRQPASPRHRRHLLSGPAGHRSL